MARKSWKQQSTSNGKQHCWDSKNMSMSTSKNSIPLWRAYLVEHEYMGELIPDPRYVTYWTASKWINMMPWKLILAMWDKGMRVDFHACVTLHQDYIWQTVKDKTKQLCQHIWSQDKWWEVEIQCNRGPILYQGWICRIQCRSEVGACLKANQMQAQSWYQRQQGQRKHKQIQHQGCYQEPQGNELSSLSIGKTNAWDWSPWQTGRPPHPLIQNPLRRQHLPRK